MTGQTQIVDKLLRVSDGIQEISLCTALYLEESPQDDWDKDTVAHCCYWDKDTVAHCCLTSTLRRTDAMVTWWSRAPARGGGVRARGKISVFFTSPHPHGKIRAGARLKRGKIHYSTDIVYDYSVSLKLAKKRLSNSAIQ